MHDIVDLSIPAGYITLWLLDRVSLLACYGEDYSIVAIVMRMEKGKKLVGHTHQLPTRYLFMRSKDLHSTIGFLAAATRDEIITRRHLMLQTPNIGIGRSQFGCR